MSTILVIEDDPLLRTHILEWLELEGYAGIAAEGGRRGIEYAHRYLPDLIICDVMMPELSGFDVMVALQNNQPTAAIPVIFLTALVTDKARQRGAELGAVAYITKPFAFADILQVIQTQLNP